METDVVNTETNIESVGTLMEAEGENKQVEQETVSNMGSSQDQDDTSIGGIADSEGGPDYDAELSIEISDVRTVNFDEEVDLDSSDPLAIIDLENTEGLSKGDSTKEGFTSPMTGSQASPRNGGNMGDCEGQVSPLGSMVGDTSQSIPDEEQSLTQSGGNMKGHQAHPDGSSSIVNGSETAKNSEKRCEERPNLNECSEGELAVSKNQNDDSARIETQTSEGDILHDLYQQTSSLHDPELNTLKTSDTVGESDKELSPPTTTQASTLLSSIADTVQKIKSEPQDQGYEDALTSAQVVKVGNCAKKQDMTERFRLPASLCRTEASNVSHTITTTSASLITTLPSPRVLPYMAMKTTVPPTLPSHVIGPTSVAPVSRAITTAAVGKEGIQTKTVALLVPLRTQGNDQGPMFVSLPSVTSKDASCTTAQSEMATCVKVSVASLEPLASAKRHVSNSVQDDGSFEKLVYDKCMQHELKSIELGKVSEFIQRRNTLKCYKASKHPSFTDKKHHACPECGDSYVLKNSLNHHMTRCSIVIKYHCDKCKGDFQFTNKCQLLTHMRLHVDASSTCKVPPPLKINSDNLSIVTPSEKDLQKATEKFNVPPKDPDKVMVRCLECRQVFANEKILKVHFGANELVCSFAFQCPVCSKVLPRQCALNAHMKIHSRMSEYVCPECGKPFTNKNVSFVRHLNDECYHQNRIFLLQCPVCNIQLESHPKMKEHCMKEHVKTIIKCTFCKEEFKTWVLLKSHIQNTHGFEPYPQEFTGSRICGLCRILLTSTCLLERHMDHHMQELKKNAKFGYQCSDCSPKKPVFTTKQLLIQHMQAVHSKLQTVSCNCCDLMFNCVFALEKHRQKLHPVQPHSVGQYENTKVTYQCGKCKVTNSSAAALKKHDCKPPIPTVPITVAMCARCKSIMASDYSKHKCPLAVKSPDKAQESSLLKGPTKPFPVQLITISKQSLMPLSGNTIRLKKIKEFSCKHCKKCLDSAGDLAVHLQSCESNLYVKRTSKTTLKSKSTPLSSSQYVFSCNLCRVRFASRDRLLIHIQDHSHKGDKICTICNVMAFKTGTQLEDHIPLCKGPDLVADPDTKVQCRVCSQYIQRVYLKTHILTHISKGKMMCRHCQRMEFQNREEFKSHEYACGFSDYPLEHNYCYVCARTFDFIEQLVCHLQQHVKEGTLVCCKCQKSEFTTKEELKAHHETCGQDYMNILPGEMCSLCRCSLHYRPTSDLHRHITQHVTKGALICCRCQKMGWDSFGEVKSHQIGCGMFTENSGLTRKDQDRKCVCTICNRDCSDMNALIVHLKRHVANGQLICTKCQKRGWKNASTLMNHEITCGVTLSKPVKASYKTMDHVCEHCGKMFRKFHLLQEHVKKEHVSFPCHLCGVAYDTKSALVSHVSVVHDGKRSLFSCSICKQKKIEKSFASQQGLEKHMRKMHRHHRRRSDSSDMNNGERHTNSSQSEATTPSSEPSSPPPVKRLRVEGDPLYTCAKCPVIMEDAAHFAEHIKEHNSDNTNQCPDCGLCFTILATLKKHLFLVHKIRDSNKYLQDRGMKTEEEEIISDSEELSPPPVKKTKWLNDSVVMRKSANPLECTVCSRTFDTDRQLKTHMRIHGMAFLCSNKRAGSVKSSPSEDALPSVDVSPTKSSGSSCSDAKISESAGSQDMEQERETGIQTMAATPLTETTQQTQSAVKVKQEPMDYY
ncbi:LOW QUALITY PROTEIN: zinc finger protein 532-like [Haliotis rubra]|uniref:LOW QUALITY PROTEIN: zinc finger protein 532-like n=1 Tax=Haliotis rubra TaxID=36100 RepID=UPI001EE5A6CE|nr:LOW QUALITY PROTEIN: zinc finger protein 532-like [Haliotis rubra]